MEIFKLFALLIAPQGLVFLNKLYTKGLGYSATAILLTVS